MDTEEERNVAHPGVEVGCAYRELCQEICGRFDLHLSCQTRPDSASQIMSLG